MATDKARMFIYLSKDVDDDLSVLYEIWKRRQVLRGVTTGLSKSKYVEYVLKRHVITEGVKIAAERRNGGMKEDLNSADMNNGK